MNRQLTRAIHDYFFAKSLDKLRPGGVMALITSRYTMDKQTDAIRRHLAEHADLLGAIRLPNTAFKANAGTEVTTDALFLLKRLPGAEDAGHAWRGLEMIDTADGPIAVNEYYARHPAMMLGTMKLQGSIQAYRNPEWMVRSKGDIGSPCGEFLCPRISARIGGPVVILIRGADMDDIRATRP
jgi:hypothetical protein